MGGSFGEGSSAVAVGAGRNGGFRGGILGGAARVGGGPCPCLICSHALNAFAFDWLSSPPFDGNELAASALGYCLCVFVFRGNADLKPGGGGGLGGGGKFVAGERGGTFGRVGEV